MLDTGGLSTDTGASALLDDAELPGVAGVELFDDDDAELFGIVELFDDDDAELFPKESCLFGVLILLLNMFVSSSMIFNLYFTCSCY